MLSPSLGIHARAPVQRRRSARTRDKERCRETLGHSQAEGAARPPRLEDTSTLYAYHNQALHRASVSCGEFRFSGPRGKMLLCLFLGNP